MQATFNEIWSLMVEVGGEEESSEGNDPSSVLDNSSASSTEAPSPELSLLTPSSSDVGSNFRSRLPKSRLEASKMSGLKLSSLRSVSVSSSRTRPEGSLKDRLVVGTARALLRSYVTGASNTELGEDTSHFTRGGRAMAQEEEEDGLQSSAAGTVVSELATMQDRSWFFLSLLRMCSRKARRFALFIDFGQGLFFFAFIVTFLFWPLTDTPPFIAFLVCWREEEESALPEEVGVAADSPVVVVTVGLKLSKSGGGEETDGGLVLSPVVEETRGVAGQVLGAGS